ncbi:MAG: SDR family oxidoreductase [Oscillospiraceae bacterium]
MNKTALITGASRGIGKACAIALDAEGYNLILNYNTSKKQAENLAKSLKNAIAIQADISNETEVNEMFKKAYETFPDIDVLVNNAGIAQQLLFTDITEQEFDKMFDVNVKGMFFACKAALPQMLRNKFGKIVNISSMWGITGASCEVHYSASKSAVIGLTKALAKEVALSNINVNCVAPGVIVTEMNKNLSQETLRDLQEETPLYRLGKPADIANAVVFLVSEKSSFITGQVLSVDGGMII